MLPERRQFCPFIIFPGQGRTVNRYDYLLIFRF